MVRKQVYIHERQEALLKQQARRQGTTEAELIRRSLDRTLGEASGGRNEVGWKRALAVMEERKKFEGRPRSWRRDDLYDRP